MPILAHQRCQNHAEREAAARCPECSRYFCRECIVDHEDRVLCGTCLKKIAEKRTVNASKFRIARIIAQSAFCFFLLWWVFYSMGRFLISIPTTFHEGNVPKAFHRQANQ